MRRFVGLVMLVVGAAVMAACGSGPDGYFVAQSRSWPMPAAAPDDPAAYRGVRFRAVYGPGRLRHRQPNRRGSLRVL